MPEILRSFDNGALALRHRAVVPNDNVDLPDGAAAIYVGTGGNVRVHDIEGTPVVYKNVGDGQVLSIVVRRVCSTLDGVAAITATDMVAQY